MIAKAVAVASPRPAWVDDALAALTTLERELLAVQGGLIALAIELRARRLERAADEVNKAYHDSEHVCQHVTSTRRGLLMSWPDEDGAR